MTFGAGWPASLVESGGSRIRERPCLKKKQGGERQRKTPNVDPWHTQNETPSRRHFVIAMESGLRQIAN